MRLRPWPLAQCAATAWRPKARTAFKTSRTDGWARRCGDVVHLGRADPDIATIELEVANEGANRAPPKFRIGRQFLSPRRKRTPTGLGENIAVGAEIIVVAVTALSHERLTSLASASIACSAGAP